MKLDDFFDRKIIEEFTIKPEIAALSKKERLALLSRLFKEEYQGKTVSLMMLEKELFAKTTAVTREHFGIYRRGSSFKGFLTKLNLTAGGNYIPLISNCEYVRSAEEIKPEQSDFHRKTFKWHYFAKEILCEGERFRVQIDVRENKNHEFVIYNVGMTPIKTVRSLENQLQENKKREPANSEPVATDVKGDNARADISCEGIVTQEIQSVKRDTKKSLIALISDAVSRKSNIGNEQKEEIQHEL